MSAHQRRSLGAGQPRKNPFRTLSAAPMDIAPQSAASPAAGPPAGGGSSDGAAEHNPFRFLGATPKIKQEHSSDGGSERSAPAGASQSPGIKREHSSGAARQNPFRALNATSRTPPTPRRSSDPPEETPFRSLSTGGSSSSAPGSVNLKRRQRFPDATEEPQGDWRPVRATPVDDAAVHETQLERNWRAGVHNASLLQEERAPIDGPHVPISSEQMRDVESIDMKKGGELVDVEDAPHTDATLQKKIMELKRNKWPRKRSKGTQPRVAAGDAMELTESAAEEETPDALAHYITEHRKGNTVAVDTDGSMCFNPLAVEQMRQDNAVMTMQDRHKKQRLVDFASQLRSGGPAMRPDQQTLNMLLQFFRHSNTACGSMKQVRIRNTDTGEWVSRTVPVDHAYMRKRRMPEVHLLTRAFEEEVLLRTPIHWLGERPCANGARCEGRRINVDDPGTLRELVFQHEYEWHMQDAERRWQHVMQNERRRRCLMCERHAVHMAWGQMMAANLNTSERDCYVSRIYNVVMFPGEYDINDVLWNTTNFQGLYGPVARHDLVSYASEVRTLARPKGEPITYYRQINFKQISASGQLDFCPEPYR